MTGFAPVIFMFANRRNNMKSTIAEFYYGNITPCETTSIDTRLQKILSDLDSLETEMLEKSPEHKELFKQFSDKNSRLAGIEIENAFCKGFRLGALFMIDVFGGTE